MTDGAPLDILWRRVFELAGRGRFSTAPNPRVGAVLVDAAGRVVGEGAHERAGGPHAEAVALAAAGARAKGATLLVNLEPCSHFGRTPPCSEALIAAGVSRVVCSTEDPDPRTAGRGIRRLRERGVEVLVGALAAEAETLNEAFLKSIRDRRPFVHVKWASSLDGRIATRTGASKWVTGPEARARVHALRAASDAVAIGIGTALADDPRLTVRDAPGVSPLRVVFDTKLRLPTHARLVETAAEIPTWVICNADAPTSAEEELTTRGVEVLRAPASAEGRIDAPAALKLLASRGIVRLMVEGGAELAGSFLAGHLADELHAFVAPILLGPRGRAGAVDWAGPDTPAEAPKIAKPTWELCGEDAYVHGTIEFPERAG